jgi:hypothetical protein
VTSDRRPLSAAEHHTRGGAPDLGFHLVYGLGVATAFKAVER